MEGYIPILDAGHGGMIRQEYQTHGKRSPNWHKGILYEGMFNRWLVNRVIEKLDRSTIPYYHISPELEDISLSVRCKRANEIYKYQENTYLFSVHANAGGGTGIEGFTTKGKTKSDKIAEVFLKNIKRDIGDVKIRADYSDGDIDKEVNFYILRKFEGPAILLEYGFMDNKEDYVKLWSKKYLEMLVDSTCKTMIDIYQIGI